MRKLLGAKLKANERKLIAGEYHDENGNIVVDLVEQATSPIIKDVIGSDYSDDELPVKAFDMVVDICDRRYKYVKKQLVKKEPDAENESDAENENADSENENTDSADDEEPKFECSECHDPIKSINECYPEAERESGMFFRCLSCWDTASAIIKFVTLNLSHPN